MGIVRFLDQNDDRNKISSVYEQSWKTAYRGIIPDDYLDSIPAGRWAAKVDTASWHTLVCLEDGQIIGTSSFSSSRFEVFKDYGEIISIYLLPEYVGKGYGRQLMERVLSELRKAGYAKAFLWVLEENKNARAFYEKMGFALSSESIESNIGGKDLIEVSYVIDLTIESTKALNIF